MKQNNEKHIINDIQYLQDALAKQEEIISELETRIELLEELFNSVEEDETFNKEYILKSVTQ